MLDPVWSQGSLAMSSRLARLLGSRWSIRPMSRRHPSDTCGGTVYLQSMIIVSVSLSFASY